MSLKVGRVSIGIGDRIGDFGSSLNGEGLASARDIEQIREFLEGTGEVAFSNPTDAVALRAFVA